MVQSAKIRNLSFASKKFRLLALYFTGIGSQSTGLTLEVVCPFSSGSKCQLIPKFQLGTVVLK